jgi:hypothetical protein
MDGIERLEPSTTDIKLDDYYVICDVCHEKMEYKVNFAQEHLVRHPNHMKYGVKVKKKN